MDKKDNTFFEEIRSELEALKERLSALEERLSDWEAAEPEPEPAPAPAEEAFDISIDDDLAPAPAAEPETAPEPEPEPQAEPEPAPAPEPAPKPVSKSEPALHKTVADAALPKGYAWQNDLPGSAVSNVLSAIGLNDRMLLINTLFGEDAALFRATIDEFNAMSSFDEAQAYVAERFPDWNLSSEPVYRLMMAVRRRLDR